MLVSERQTERKDQFEKLCKSASKIEPIWKPIITVNGAKKDGQSKILAQCCKPGACSPKG